MINQRKWRRAYDSKRLAISKQLRVVYASRSIWRIDPALRRCTSLRQAVPTLLSSTLVKRSPNTMVRVRDVVRQLYYQLPSWVEGDPREVKAILLQEASRAFSYLGIVIGFVDGLAADCVGNVSVAGCELWQYRLMSHELVIDEQGWLEPTPVKSMSDLAIPA